MKLHHALLALLVTAVWGCNFVVIHAALVGIPPMLLVTLRFVVSLVPVFFLPRPALSWPTLIALALTLFFLQFGFLFTAMTHGMPPGLASLTLQSQAPFTVLLAAVVLHERPTRQQVIGLGIAVCGMAIVALSIIRSTNGDVTLLGLGLIAVAALCWAMGNVLLRRAGKVDMLALISWLSLMTVVPMLILSFVMEGTSEITQAITHMTGHGVAAILYIGVISTTFGYALWGQLFKLYPAPLIAPFSLLIPVFGMLASSLVFGEQFPPLRVAGMAVVLLGLAVMVVPVEWVRRRQNA